MQSIIECTLGCNAWATSRSLTCAEQYYGIIYTHIICVCAHISMNGMNTIIMTGLIPTKKSPI